MSEPLYKPTHEIDKMNARQIRLRCEIAALRLDSEKLQREFDDISEALNDAWEDVITTKLGNK